MSQGDVRVMLRDAVVVLLRRGDLIATEARQLLAFARRVPELVAALADAEARAPGEGVTTDPAASLRAWLAPVVEVSTLEATMDVVRWQECATCSSGSASPCRGRRTKAMRVAMSAS